MSTRQNAMKIIVFIVGLVLSSNCFAVNIWWNGGVDNNWFEQKNYSPRMVPESTVGINWSLSTVNKHATLLIDSGDAVCYSLWSYNEFDNTSIMKITGGSLTATYILTGSGSVHGDSKFIVEGGAVTCDKFTVGRNYLSGAGIGYLIMDSATATITTRVLELNYANAKGIILLNAGTINIGSGGLLMENSASYYHTIDIGAGQMVIDGDKTSFVNTYIVSGHIVGYGGSGVVEIDYNVTNPGKTTIKAHCDAAWGPVPKNGTEHVKTGGQLSWQPGTLATPLGYNIYLGTDYYSVLNAVNPNIVPGQGTVLTNSFNPGTLTEGQTYYWRVDEVTSGMPVVGSVWSFTADSNNVSDYPMAFEVSTADNHYVASWMPVESPAGINASFDLMKEVYNAGRIYWRGLQESQWATEEITHVGGYPLIVDSFFPWMKYLVENMNVNQYAVAAAHARNMEIWGEGTIMDWGAGPASNTLNTYPFAHEAAFRKAHPEWVPVDKYGRRKQGGPIEMAYPEARQYLVNLIVNQAFSTGYDGVTLILYAENCSIRFQDEFGYNQPVVDEFKNRYGVNIRTQDFNRQAWYNLRGEYFTQFLRELKNALTTHNIKLGITINGSDPSIPILYKWSSTGGVIATAGHITMDFQTWINEGLVNLLQVHSYNCTQSEMIQTIQTLQTSTAGTDVEVVFRTFNLYDGDLEVFQQAGLETVGTLGDVDDYLFQNALPFQELSALTDSQATIYQKMRVLAQIIWHQTAATYDDVIPFATNANPLVKQLALRALAAIGGSSSLSVIEDALLDPEIAVRHGAMTALSKISGPDTPGKILAAINQYPDHAFIVQARTALTACNNPSYSAVKQFLAASMTNHSNYKVREICAIVLDIIGSADVVTALITAMSDENPAVRFYAVEALNSSASKNNPTAINALLSALQNTNDIYLSNRAAIALGDLYAMGCTATAARKTEIISDIATIYEQKAAAGYYTADDAEWAFRPLGLALLDFGQGGRDVLDGFINQKIDMTLAEKAWYSTYIPMPEGSFNLVTEAESDAAHQYFPLPIQSNTWWQGLTDSNWFNKNNYLPVIVPSGATGVNWSLSGVGTHGKIIINGGKVNCLSLWSYNEYNSTSEMIVSGGSLTATYILTGSGSVHGDSKFIVEGGAITCDKFTVGRNYLSGAGIGYLIMDSATATITTRVLELNYANAKGIILLKAGTINVGSGGLLMEDSATHYHTIDIGEGQIVLDGDKATFISTYIASGHIVAFGGSGTVNVDYNITNPGKTTIHSSL